MKEKEKEKNIKVPLLATKRIMDMLYIEETNFKNRIKPWHNNFKKL
ncbi:hypothetical protein BVRB_6g139770 [Beta vulgaris subsp. vulgaris]|nr:hypothetical protein BVRB_6g139770 [Beta vulgaris subsp. vulgaris]